MVTRKNFLTAFVAVSVFLLLAGNIFGQYRGNMLVPIPKLQSYDKFLEENPNASQDKIEAGICQAFGIKAKDLETRREHFGYIFRELPITKNGRPVAKLANRSQENLILWNSLYCEEDDRQRLVYTGCLLPLEDRKQNFCIWFRDQYYKQDSNWTAKKLMQSFDTYAAKNNVEFENWELREAYMFLVLCQIAREQQGKKPLTLGELMTDMEDLAEEYELEYRQYKPQGGKVSLLTTYTAKELESTAMQFNHTVLMNCVVENVRQSKFDAMSEKFANEVLNKLRTAGFAFTLNEIRSAGQQYKEINSMCLVGGGLIMALETARAAGDKPVFLAIGENHVGAIERNLETYLMRIAVRYGGEEPGRTVFVPEHSESSMRIALMKKDTCSCLAFSGGLSQAVTLYTALGIDCVAVDLLRGKTAQPAKSPEGSYLRSVKMAETICGQIQLLLKDKTVQPQRMFAVGIYGGEHLSHFRNSSIPEISETFRPDDIKDLRRALEKVSVPILVKVYQHDNVLYCFNNDELSPNKAHPEMLQDIRGWGMLRQLFSRDMEKIAKSLDSLRSQVDDFYIEEAMRSGNLADAFADTIYKNNESVEKGELIIAEWFEATDATWIAGRGAVEKREPKQQQGLSPESHR